MTHCREKTDPEAGFTLVELLVSFVLLGFVMALLYGGFGFANRVLERTTSASVYMEEVVQVQHQLRDLVSRAYPDHTVFTGTRDRLEFLAPISRLGVEEGLYRVILQNERGYDSENLVLMLEPSGLGKQAGTEPVKAVLLEHVSDIEFSYLGAEENRQPGSWGNMWAQKEKLPGFLKLTLKLEKSLHNAWPTLIIPFQITQNVDCRYDTVSRNCISR